MDREIRRRIRGAVFRGDTAEIMAVLTSERAREVPQIAGHALLVVLEQDALKGADLAAEILAHVTERNWDGDAELAVELRRALGQPGATSLAPIPVDVEQLVYLLQGGERQSGGRLNVRTGEALPHLAYADRDDQFDGDEDAVDDEWLYVDALGSREAYRDMERFIAEVVPPLIAATLTEAITGRGAFSRFRARLSEWPDLADAWQIYSEDRWFGRARRWLAEAGYRPSQPPAA